MKNWRDEWGDLHGVKRCTLRCSANGVELIYSKTRYQLWNERGWRTAYVHSLRTPTMNISGLRQTNLQRVRKVANVI